MAFWGVEVKPGKPFTHSLDSVRGRLRISQATLAIGSTTKKSLVQCNVGDKSPVLLCALLPDKTESCQLDLEFEEADEVVFSVIGPRSVHLTGYYLGNSRNSKLDDESESYGEDIANTDTEERNHSSDDDEYEDSFINDDDDPDVLPPSPVSSDGVDEVVEIKKPKDRKSVHKRLKKRYQSVESDEETNSRQQNDINGSRAAAIQESESEDDIPISSIFHTKEIVKNMTEEKTLFNTKAIAKNAIEEKTNKETVENVDKMAEDDEPKSKEDPQSNSLPPSEEVGPENKTKQKKKKKEMLKETATDRGSDLQHNSLVPPSEIAPKNGMKPKKKRKERSKAEKNHIADSEEVSENSQKSKKRRKERAQDQKSHEDRSPSRIKEDQARQDETNTSGNMNKDMNVRNQQDQKPSSESIDIDSAQLASEKKNKKKRKKGNKILENDENVNTEVPLSPKEEKNRSVKESKDKNVDTLSSRARTLSNGLIVEDLESGKSEGKIAAPGRKVKVYYIGKLKENGQVIDSNIGKAPFRFRLGDKEIIEGWNLGLDGMRAGDKRRLVIPPTLGYGSQGTGENIPPNSWLVYDMELVSVR